MTSNQHFGRRIRRLREEAGLSLRALAAKSGVSFNTISRTENGNGIWLEHAAKLAGALGESLDALIAESVCSTCDGIPPVGFTCRECGRSA